MQETAIIVVKAKKPQTTCVSHITKNAQMES